MYEHVLQGKMDKGMGGAMDLVACKGSKVVVTIGTHCKGREMEKCSSVIIIFALFLPPSLPLSSLLEWWIKDS